MFRQDYKAMQHSMIYGTTTDFDTMINQLKILRGRFRLLEEYHILENIIKEAQANVDADKSFKTEGATFNTPVHYLSDLNKPSGPTNKNISYNVKLVRNANKWVFESITINLT